MQNQIVMFNFMYCLAYLFNGILSFYGSFIVKFDLFVNVRI